MTDQCPNCKLNWSLFPPAPVDERKPDGTFSPGPRVRCINCKLDYPTDSRIDQLLLMKAVYSTLINEVTPPNIDLSIVIAALGEIIARYLAFVHTTTNADNGIKYLETFINTIYTRYSALTIPPETAKEETP